MSALSTTRTLSENVGKIDVFLDSCAVCSMMIGEPGGASNAYPGSDHKRPQEGTRHG